MVLKGYGFNFVLKDYVCVIGLAIPLPYYQGNILTMSSCFLENLFA